MTKSESSSTEIIGIAIFSMPIMAEGPLRLRRNPLMPKRKGFFCLLFLRENGTIPELGNPSKTA